MVAYPAPDYSGLDLEIEKQREFAKELQALINKHSMEKYSDTPDFILAEYLLNCLKAWELSVGLRESHYGRVKTALNRDDSPQPK